MPVLDGWRGLAIVLVVLHNSSYVVSRVPSLSSTLVHSAYDAGWVGVTLFFVLSGFLITGILLDTQGTPQYIRRFYVRRTLRIFPLYYLALVVAFLVPVAFSIGWSAPSWKVQVWYWAYASNWLAGRSDVGVTGLSHFWSLAVEEQFYLAWPLLLVASTRRRFGQVAVLVAVGALFARIALVFGEYPPQAIYEYTISRCDALAVGGLLAFGIRERSTWLTWAWPRRSVFLALVTSTALATVLLERGFAAESRSVQLAGHSLVAVLFAIGILVTISPSSTAERIASTMLSARVLRFLGKHSYAMYVIHFPLHLLLLGRAAGVINRTDGWTRIGLTMGYGVLLLGASAGLAVASWHLFEKRVLGLKDRLAPRPGAPVSSAVAGGGAIVSHQSH